MAGFQGVPDGHRDLDEVQCEAGLAQKLAGAGELFYTSGDSSGEHTGEVGRRP